MSVRETSLLERLCLVALLAGASLAAGYSVCGSGDLPLAPESSMKLVFIHHSCGENWLADEDGGLGLALMENGYFVSDTNYGWGPACMSCDGCFGAIGDCTDIPHWPEWFLGSSSDLVLRALYSEFEQHASYTRVTDPDSVRENEIILFKSCYPNSNLAGRPGDPPDNTSRLTVGGAKWIYIQLLEYFSSQPGKLFVAITAPPVTASDSWENPDNARAFNNWLVNDWLADYPLCNVAVFDFYNVLTSNAGSSTVNDVNIETGNHHRWWNGSIQHIQTVNWNLAAYASGDSHPTQAGNRKATAEFVPLLNEIVRRWLSNKTLASIGRLAGIPGRET